MKKEIKAGMILSLTRNSVYANSSSSFKDVTKTVEKIETYGDCHSEVGVFLKGSPRSFVPSFDSEGVLYRLASFYPKPLIYTVTATQEIS